MILRSDDLTDWVIDRESLLIAAWIPEIETMLAWEPPFAEALAAELHAGMVMTMQRRGTEVNFHGVVARSGTGLDPKTERAIADRFYGVTLKLARAAARRVRHDRSRAIFPYLQAFTVRDSRVSIGHAALQGIVLPSQHSFWQRWHPPLDMDCRCGTIQRMRSQLIREGLTVTSEAELADRESQLSAAWPPAFAPLLDFRRP